MTIPISSDFLMTPSIREKPVPLGRTPPEQNVEEDEEEEEEMEEEEVEMEGEEAVEKKEAAVVAVFEAQRLHVAKFLLGQILLVLPLFLLLPPPPLPSISFFLLHLPLYLLFQAKSADGVSITDQ